MLKGYVFAYECGSVGGCICACKVSERVGEVSGHFCGYVSTCTCLRVYAFCHDIITLFTLCQLTSSLLFQLCQLTGENEAVT